MSEIYTGRNEVSFGLRHLKVGDVVVDLIPSGDQLIKCQMLGLPSIFGCVGTPSQLDDPIVRVGLWSTLFNFYPNDFGSKEQRTFSVDTTEAFEAERAELYIPSASKDRFAYGQRIAAFDDASGVTMVVDSYLGGFVSGLTDSGIRYTVSSEQCEVT